MYLSDSGNVKGGDKRNNYREEDRLKEKKEKNKQRQEFNFFGTVVVY